MSELLAEALGRRKASVAESAPFQWHTTPGRLLIDLEDKDAVYAALDSESVRLPRP
jgi:hypothetical protein